ncbi:hypothetical protein [Burkholderia gladioli]|uniref:hypothetical protein n=1 Tax=Burkholderia gladioli TaxID=28095 RepID=UPI00163EE605|nr:hypothetical protein [Burkholderia gladioli]
MSDKLSDEQWSKLVEFDLLIDEYQDAQLNGNHAERTVGRAQLKQVFREALLAASPEPDIPADQWQPIETAPKETELLGWRADCGVMLIVYTSFDRFATDQECEETDEVTLFQKDWFGSVLQCGLERLEGSEKPTHWMPLPVDPTDATLKAAPAISESYIPDAARNEGAA